MSRSVWVPEKTLEHWSSQYVAYRYRAQAAQWWPARGEDIDVGWLPARAGKAVQLELKTARIARAGVHDVEVDLGQLWDYRRLRRGHQPFYVFPRPNPDWDGDLVTAAADHRRAVTELGFARSGHGWWFADWMLVLTAAQVAAVLHREVAAHGSGVRGKKARLVRFDRSHHSPIWGSGAAAPSLLTWREFWLLLESCGRPEWPQLIRLPARLIRTELPITSSSVAVLLAAAAGTPDTGGADPGELLVTLEPGSDGTYQVMSAPSGGPSAPDEDAIGGDDEDDHASDHRQVVFLYAGATPARRRGRGARGTATGSAAEYAAPRLR